jgi:hypothetical protein
MKRKISAADLTPSLNPLQSEWQHEVSASVGAIETCEPARQENINSKIDIIP